MFVNEHSPKVAVGAHTSPLPGQSQLDGPGMLPRALRPHKVRPITGGG